MIILSLSVAMSVRILASLYAYSCTSLRFPRTIHNDGQTIFFLTGKDEYISPINQKNIQVDIPTREMTMDQQQIKVGISIREILIFERVFLKGGKVSR